MSLHGCVDTFSGKIVWLKVWTGNHDPDLIEMFYLKALKENDLFPYATRSDYGTETLGIYKTQHALHAIYETGVEHPHQYVKSTSNTKIESLWHRYLTEFGRTIMAHLEHAFNNGIYAMNNCLEEFIYMYLWIPFMQVELDNYVKRCDNQKRQKSKINLLPTCAPLFAYNNPSEFGAMNCGYSDPKLMDLVDVRLSSLCLNRDLTHLFPNRFKESADYVYSMFLGSPVIELQTIDTIYADMLKCFIVMSNQ